MDHNVLQAFLQELFNNYQENVIDVTKITNELINRNVIANQSEIVNDHIAFRTLGIDHLGIQSFEKIFLAHGYKKMDYYNFEAKKLNAHWYAPPTEDFPRVFISELRVNDLSKTAQNIIHKYTHKIKSDPINNIDLNNEKEIGAFLHQPLWDIPTLSDYKLLCSESEYAAWVIFNRYYLNHYTISVQNLPEKYNTLAEFNKFLEEIKIKLNTAGGIIKESNDGLLLQSSSISYNKTVKFACGNQDDISGSYVEFAERKILPEFKHLPKSQISRIHRKEGFEAKNADKIFESTYSSQTKKEN